MSRRKTSQTPAPKAVAASLLVGPGAWERRGAVILGCACLFLFVFFAYAGRFWADALHRLLFELPVLIAWLAAMLGVGSLLYRCFTVRGQPGSFATSAALGIGFYSLLTLALGWAGVLNRGLSVVVIV